MSGFKIKGADGKTITIPDGEYYFNTKARVRRMMFNSLSSDARRVYACLELGTMGFQQELAVVMTKKGQRPMTPSDIRDQSEMSKQNVRRGLEELEGMGLAERRGSGGGPLIKGKVELYSWSVPREPKKENGSRARLPFPTWFPDSWAPLKPVINRFKYRLPADFVVPRDYLSDGDEAARDYQKAEIVVVAFLDRVCAGAKKSRIKKEQKEPERTKAAVPVRPAEGLEKDRTPPPPPPEMPVSGTAIIPWTEKQEEEGSSSSFETLAKLYPEEKFDEGNSQLIFDALPEPERAIVIERLHVYRASPQWHSDGGQWIPKCSNWLKTYKAAPPKPLNLKKRGQNLEDQLGHVSEVVKVMKAINKASGGTP